VDSIEECAEKIVYLLENPALTRRLGQKGKEVVTHNFLTPRLVHDELSLIKNLLVK
jgi:trehalose synthase